MVQYAIARATDIRSLEFKLNELSENGFVAQGGIVFSLLAPNRPEYSVLMSRTIAPKKYPSVSLSSDPEKPV